ncbi:MAG TPA: hypothetical protein VGL79_03675 [Solirubrobacteraceae bacterium]|jgi:hypothetical protein
MADLPEPGYRLKLRRAKEHLDAIDMEVRTFTEHNLGAAVPFDPQPEDEWTTISRGTVAPPDPRWGTILGDFIHNTRSALDNLVCAMILHNDPSNSLEDAYFPAYDGWKKWDAEIASRDRDANGPAPTDGMAPDVLAAIEESQPYHIKGAAARRHAPLLLLQTASNLDKHRTIHAASIEIAPRDIFPGELRAIPPGFFQLRKAKIAAPGTPVETGAEIGRAMVRVIDTPPPDMEVGVYARTAIAIRFSIEGRPFKLLHTEVWEMIGAAWRAVLRAEHAAGINIASLPLPHDKWNWHPADPKRDPLIA